MNFPAIEVIGRDGRNLGKWWRDNRFQAYEGVAVPKFPNFLTLASPYSYSGLSYFTTIESQMAHMTRLFTEMRRQGADVFEVTEDANTRFLDRMTANLDDSGVLRRQLQFGALVLLQPARRGGPAASDVDGQRLRGGAEFPAGRLPDGVGERVRAGAPPLARSRAPSAQYPRRSPHNSRIIHA